MATAVLRSPRTLSPRSRPRSRRRFHIVVLSLGALALFYGFALTFYWPFTKQALVDVLQERSLREVTVGAFRQTYFPPGCVAEHIRFLRVKHKDREPLLSINKLVVRDNYLSILTFQRRLSRVDVVGLHLMVPAREPAGEPSPIAPLTYSRNGSGMPIGVITANNAILDFFKADAHAAPLRLVVKSLRLRDVSSDKPLHYNVIVENSAPPGEIASNGDWGPWNPKNPGTTPAHGRFTYRNADLSAFQDFTGMLLGNGNFSGSLARLQTAGSVHVRQFGFKEAQRRRDADALYDASVNAINGDVFLKSVTAAFEGTSIAFHGAIAGGEGISGKQISTDLFTSKARIEDLVDLFSSSGRSAMTGAVDLQGHADVPPGPDPFLVRMRLNGVFGIQGTRFTDPSTSRDLARLSASSKKDDTKQRIEDPRTVLSDLSGTVNAAGGIAHMENVSFRMPGASATLHGTFDLIKTRSDLHGVLVTDGSVGDAATGIRSLLMKALTPFLHKRGKAKAVAFKITGPFGNTQIGLDLEKSLK